MAQITEFVNVSAILQTAAAPRTSFGIGLFLVDDDQVPVDARYQYMTQSSKSTWTSGTDPRSFGDIYFQQKRTPQKLMIGRWASSATSPYFVCVGFATTIATWTAVADGSLTVTTAAGADALTLLDFTTGVTTLADVASKIDAALVAGGVSGARCSIDALNRIIFTDPAVTGAGTTIAISGGGPGTDLYTSTYLNGANGFTQAGVDAEEPVDTLTEISNLDDSYYEVMAERSLTTTQQVALATAINSLKKQCTLVYNSTDAKSSGTSTDLGSQVQALGLSRAMSIYTEHTTQWPDAANNGCVLPAVEGTTEFGFEVLSGVSESGLAGDGTAKALTPTEITVLEGKGYSRVADVGGVIFCTGGFNANGVEHRIMLGKDWFEARTQEGVFNLKIQNPLTAFDNATLGQQEDVVLTYSTEAITRGILVNTPERPFVIDFPDADDFTQAERASHGMVLDNVFYGYLNSSAVTVDITGTWTI
jgi:hypothetical protein